MMDKSAPGTSCFSSNVNNIAQGSSSDATAGNLLVSNKNATVCPSSTVDREIHHNGKINNGSNVRSNFLNTPHDNGNPMHNFMIKNGGVSDAALSSNHGGHEMLDNRAVLDAVINMFPPTHTNNLPPMHPASMIPNPSLFGNSNPTIQGGAGSSVGGNPSASVHYTSPMLFASSPFRPTGNENLFRNRSTFGYPHAPGTEINQVQPDTERTPQNLLSLDMLLDRTSGAEPRTIIREEDDKEPMDDGEESSTCNQKKTTSTHRENNKTPEVSLSFLFLFSSSAAADFSDIQPP